MHAVLSLILIGTLGFQSAVGCVCRVARTAPMAKVECKKCRCQHDESLGESGPSSQPCKCQLQRDGRTYVSTPKTMPSRPDDFVRFETVALTCPAIAGRAFRDERDSVLHQPRGGLPLYLAHQLLLV